MRGERHIHLDAVGGVAGDMFVAALLDAFPDLADRVLADVAAVLPPDAGRAVMAEGTSGGMRTLRFRLEGAAVAPRASGSYAHLVEMIRVARLHEGTASAAVAILTNLARAEAHVHHVPLEDVHFHELADWDSVMDVVAAGSIVAALPGTRWTVSDLPLGSGHVHSAHGRLPVPAPATVALLRGFRWRDDGISGERVTPTGAAILVHLVPADAQRVPEDAILTAIGHGGGTRELAGMPNVLRCLVFDLEGSRGEERVAVISFDVDDMTGEETGVAAERLRTEPGVLDVSLGTRFGKKSRPVTSFRLLVDPTRREAVARRCLSETTTLGLRWRVEERMTLVRRNSIAATADGAPVRIKHAQRPNGRTTRKAESDDLQEVAGVEERRARKARAERDAE